jgi:hypothetical protein
MAIRKKIIKQNHIEAIVKVVNPDAAAASVTIGLATDLLRSDEELVPGVTPTVNLGSMETSVQINTEANITRNGIVIVNFFENTEQFEMGFGADTENNTSDLVVNFTGKGTIYMRLLKVKGYRAKFRPEQNTTGAEF